MCYYVLDTVSTFLMGGETACILSYFLPLDIWLCSFETFAKITFTFMQKKLQEALADNYQPYIAKCTPTGQMNRKINSKLHILFYKDKRANSTVFSRWEEWLYLSLRETSVSSCIQKRQLSLTSKHVGLNPKKIRYIEHVGSGLLLT